jgi:hypothetical protein
MRESWKMRASHKKRVGRLIAALDDAERRAFDERCELTLEAVMSGDIRIAMERRGIDPGSARVLRQTEARLAKLADSPELEAADAAWLEAHREAESPDDEDPLDWLADELWRIGQRYLDGSQPDFRFAPLIDLWAWSLIQYCLLPAIPDDGYGVSVNTSLVRGIVE